MAGQKTITSSYYEFIPPPVPPPVADYHIDTVTVPACAGNYFIRGNHDGRTYCSNTDNTFFIWWYDGGGSYVISTALGVIAPGYWRRGLPIIDGTYNHMGTFTLHPIVLVGP